MIIAAAAEVLLIIIIKNLETSIFENLLCAIDSAILPFKFFKSLILLMRFIYGFREYKGFFCFCF